MNPYMYLPVEKDIGLTVDHLTNVHLCHILVIKLIPLLSEHVLTVRCVMTS